MNRLHNKHKNTNKKRTCKSNKENRKTLKRRGRSNKKGGSRGRLSCLSCFRGNGRHSSSKTERINNEIKQLYIYTIFNGILFVYTGESQYLTTFNVYRSKLTSHIAYLDHGVPVPSNQEKHSIDEGLMKSHVTDLDSNLGSTRDHGHGAPPISGVTNANRPIIRSEFDRVKTAANEDQPPFDRLNEILNRYVNIITHPPPIHSIGQAGGHSNKQ
jgi:hypothetical protein